MKKWIALAAVAVAMLVPATASAQGNTVGPGKIYKFGVCINCF
jgi:hypothetical protein